MNNLAAEIPIKLNGPDMSNREYVSFKRIVTSNQNREEIRAQVLKADSREVEVILQTITEFKDAASATRLNYSSGPKLYTNFRLCLNNSLRRIWDKQVQGVNQTVNSFDNQVLLFVANFLPPNALSIQQQSLAQS